MSQRLVMERVLCGDCLEEMKRLPSGCIDLAFADPPYNLGKVYGKFNDSAADEQYRTWCEEWLREYIRLLKPTGSLFVVNLPKWGLHHVQFLNRHLFFRQWIVWDALSEPRGKVMPAHYAILYYTKDRDKFTLNPVPPSHPKNLCLRSNCVQQQRELLREELDEQPLTDVWHDIHRLKHRGRRFGKHPCQMPESLLERIILMASNKGDIILDAMAGTGTTLVVAKRFGRKFIGIDIDQKFVDMTLERLEKITIAQE